VRDDPELLAEVGRVVAPAIVTAAPVAELPGVPFTCGAEAIDADLWLDRDGRVHRGDGPYLNRPLRRLRRAIRQWWLR